MLQPVCARSSRHTARHAGQSGEDQHTTDRAKRLEHETLGRTINGHTAGAFTRDDVLDDITLYWLTNTAISSARLYWENRVGLSWRKLRRV
jgi:hypothetical protein